jgi:hypothetical protein
LLIRLSPFVRSRSQICGLTTDQKALLSVAAERDGLSVADGDLSIVRLAYLTVLTTRRCDAADKPRVACQFRRSRRLILARPQ